MIEGFYIPRRTLPSRPVAECGCPSIALANEVQRHAMRLEWYGSAVDLDSGWIDPAKCSAPVLHLIVVRLLEILVLHHDLQGLDLAERSWIKRVFEHAELSGLVLIDLQVAVELQGLAIHLHGGIHSILAFALYRQGNPRSCGRLLGDLFAKATQDIAVGGVPVAISESSLGDRIEGLITEAKQRKVSPALALLNSLFSLHGAESLHPGHDEGGEGNGDGCYIHASRFITVVLEGNA